MAILLDTGADMLKVKVFDTSDAMGMDAALNAARLLNSYIKQKGSVSAVFAAAPSQNQFLYHLLKQDIDWTKVNAYHMDEYIGLDEKAPQGFGNFLKEAIFDRVPFASVNYINGQAKNPEEECKRYAKLLKNNKPDIVFLGIGENGHLAFNDPSVADFNDPLLVKVVELDPVCRNQQVNDGCFNSMEEVPTHAITLTMSMLFGISEALVIVPGPTKRKAVYDTVKGEISTKCPASVLRTHKNAVLYADAKSAADLI